jgi:hypothetical protein
MVAHSHSPSAARVPHQTCVLPSIATTDLCDELIHHCRREDNRITIECHRERHCNIKSRNLERDLNLLRQHGRRMRLMLCVPLALQ